MEYLLHPHTPMQIVGEPSLPVRCALRDIEKDWYRVFGYPLLKLTEFTGEWNGFRLVLDCRNTQLPEDLRPCAPEEFTVAIHGGVLYLTGSDTRGCIYALYQFSRRILGVDPLWYFNDALPARQQVIPIPDGLYLRSRPCFRYRGWFINDEDILNGFFSNQTDDGVMSPEGFAHILEALLRLGGNMLVPGSFAMPDEKVRQQMAARGVVSNDHHVTPLGLNMYRWPEDVPFSYSHGKEQLEQYWQTCVDTLKGYEQVWTVSFRGKNDHPYWQEDPYAPETDEGRAAEVEAAIQTQIRLIRKADPNAEIAFNMYHEQADFYRRGLLHIPEGIIRVWPGRGCFDADAALRTEPGDGIYYHLTGAASNRYTDMKSPEVIFRTLSDMWQAKATAFCLFNVSNLRHLAISCAAGMDFLWYADMLAPDPGESARRWLAEYLSRHYGPAAEAVGKLYERFYALPVFHPLPDEYAFDLRMDFGYTTGIFRRTNAFSPDLKQHAAIQGLCRVLQRPKSSPVEAGWLEDAASFGKACRYCDEALSALLHDAEAQKADVPAGARSLYLTQMLTQLRLLTRCNRAIIALCSALSAADRVVPCSEALLEMQMAVSDLHEAEYGKWDTWYETERFACLYYSRDMVENALRVSKGQPPLPVRYVGGYRNWLYFWDQMYDYQHRNRFPLLGR